MIEWHTSAITLYVSHFNFMTPATEEKRTQFQDFIKRVLEPETAVKAVIGIGSIATGHMRPDSDIDAIIFLDPFDLYIVPAEAIWRPSDDTFHTIFSDDPQLQQEGIQLDFVRLNWQQWRDPEFEWPEERRAELSSGWVAYAHDEKILARINERTAYPEELRLARLDHSLTWLDQHLSAGTPQRLWQTLPPTLAHDRLEAAYHYLVQALFAYNRQWRIWRNREMGTLLTLPWLPPDFAGRVLIAANAPSLDEAGFMARAEMLSALFAELLAQLIENGDYSSTPIDQAFIRSHDEPGRAWNMDEWNKFRTARKLSANNGG